MRIQRLGLESEVLIPELFSGAKVLVVSDIGEERLGVSSSFLPYKIRRSATNEFQAGNFLRSAFL